MTEDKSHFPDGQEFKLLREKHPSILQALDDIAGAFDALFTLVSKQENSHRYNGCNPITASLSLPRSCFSLCTSARNGSNAFHRIDSDLLSIISTS